MTKWQHKCSLEWMRARQRSLTASDIKELLPVTKTGRPRTVSEEAYWKVLARKLVALTEEDCMSYGAAARGHILEPYAIERYNVRYAGNMLHHWDDIVIFDQDSQLAFSPDALDIQPDCAFFPVVSFNKLTPKPTRLGEVKCYSAEKHLSYKGGNPLDFEERWQIATAFAVCDTLDTAKLILFNPSLPRNYSLFVWSYTRSMLEKEIEIVHDIDKQWNRFLLDNGINVTRFGSVADSDEAKLIDEIIEREELAPFKTVIQ